jgi:hypothetical protein
VIVEIMEKHHLSSMIYEAQSSIVQWEYLGCAGSGKSEQRQLSREF